MKKNLKRKMSPGIVQYNFQSLRSHFEKKYYEILLNYMKVWEYYLKVWKKITRPIKLGKFPNEQFDVTGRMMTEMLLETVQFRYFLQSFTGNKF